MIGSCRLLSSLLRPQKCHRSGGRSVVSSPRICLTGLGAGRASQKAQPASVCCITRSPHRRRGQPSSLDGKQQAECSSPALGETHASRCSSLVSLAKIFPNLLETTIGTIRGSDRATSNEEPDDHEERHEKSAGQRLVLHRFLVKWHLRVFCPERLEVVFVVE